MHPECRGDSKTVGLANIENLIFAKEKSHS